MHRGLVSTFPISLKIARDRSSWLLINSNSDGVLSVWWEADLGSVCANAAENAIAVQQAIVRTDRTNIVAPF